MPDNYEVFGAEIRSLRIKRQLTQVELAKKSELSQTTITKIENGEQRPSPESLQRLAAALGASAPKLATLLPADTRAHTYLANKVSQKRSPNLSLPHYGDVPCGTPIDVNVPPEPDSLDVFTPLVSQPDRFLLTAKGRSMTGRGIQEGDKLIIQKQPVADNGQLAVVVVNDKVTLKVLRTINRKIYLCAASNDEEHERIEYVEGRDRIQGVVVGLVRRFTV